MKERLEYIDICKCIAMFLVTCSHCAQAISVKTWTNFLGGSEIDIAFNMPLFMIASGWVINIDKIRNYPAIDYIKKKSIRLIVPSGCWYLAYSLLTLNWPSSDFFHFYWYLNALYISSMLLLVFAKVTTHTGLCCLFSNLFVICLPNFEQLHLNFMFPFLWAGYGLRELAKKNKLKYAFFFSIVIALITGCYWNEKYSDYVTPFDISHWDYHEFFIYIYRFFTGLSMSIILIFIIREYRHQPLFSKLAKFGKYTLVVYAFSFIINRFVNRLFFYLHYSINVFILIDVLSVIGSILIHIISYYIYNHFQSQPILKNMFLGETNSKFINGNQNNACG